MMFSVLDPTGTLRPVKIQMPAGVHVGDVMKCILLVAFMNF